MKWKKNGTFLFSINLKWTTKCREMISWEKNLDDKYLNFMTFGCSVFKNLKGHIFWFSSETLQLGIDQIFTLPLGGRRLKDKNWNSPSSLFWLCHCRYSKLKSRAATHVLMAPLALMREKCMWPLIAVSYFCWLAICWAHGPCS